MLFPFTDLEKIRAGGRNGCADPARRGVRSRQRPCPARYSWSAGLTLMAHTDHAAASMHCTRRNGTEDRRTRRRQLHRHPDAAGLNAGTLRNHRTGR
ncbi:MAG: hypothetical protein MZW92_46105 [Comamonadaceae bacterium]|nr:hypothetical protein [Comamonadaceae bacterium]